MSDIFVNQSGSWHAAKQIHVKRNGSWSTVKAVYVKQNGSWVKTFPTSGSTSLTSGSGTFTVPNGIYSIFVEYPTTSGMTSQFLGVTPGDTISYNIGSFGSGSSFGSISAPAFNKTVLTFSGNVDDRLGINFAVATSGGSSYSGAGSNQSELQPAAAANGCVYEVTQQTFHGDLYGTINLATVPRSLLRYSYQVAYSYYSGRYGAQGLGSITPSWYDSNLLLSSFSIYDPGYSEGGYDLAIDLQQVVGFYVSW